MWRLWQRVAVPFEVTDIEYVQRIRRTVALYDRRRWLLLAFCVVLTVGLVGVVVTAVSLFQGLLQGRIGQGVVPGFLIGLALGAQLGGLIGFLAPLLGCGVASNTGRLAFCLGMATVSSRSAVARHRLVRGRTLVLTAYRHVGPPPRSRSRPGSPGLQGPRRGPPATAPPATLRHHLRPGRHPPVRRRPLRRLAA